MEFSEDFFNMYSTYILDRKKCTNVINVAGSPDDNQNLEGETYSAGLCQVSPDILAPTAFSDLERFVLRTIYPTMPRRSFTARLFPASTIKDTLVKTILGINKGFTFFYKFNIINARTNRFWDERLQGEAYKHQSLHPSACMH
jgi:hypothetical protein